MWLAQPTVVCITVYVVGTTDSCVYHLYVYVLGTTDSRVYHLFMYVFCSAVSLGYFLGIVCNVMAIVK